MASSINSEGSHYATFQICPLMQAAASSVSSSSFFFWHYNSWRTLASSKIVLHCSWSCDSHLQSLTPIFFQTSTHQLRFSYTSSVFWFKYSKLSLTVQFLHSKDVSQPPQSSYFYQFTYVTFIIERTRLIIVSCSPYTIIVNRTINYP